MPLLQDQFQSADRIEYMELGPSGIDSQILFPRKLIKSLKIHETNMKNMTKKDIFVPRNIDNIEISFKGSIPSSKYISNNHGNLKSMNSSQHIIETDIAVDPTSDFICSSSSFSDSTCSSSSDSSSVSISDSEFIEMQRLVNMAVIQLERRLRFVSNPLHRLKCGCYGRSLRADEKENGLKNAAAVVISAFERVKLLRENRDKERDKDEDKYNNKDTDKEQDMDRNMFGDKNNERKLLSDTQEGKSILLGKRDKDLIKEEIKNNNTYGSNNKKKHIVETNSEDEWQEFDCGVRLATHQSASEESQFLYNEIFEKRVYLKHGIVINENDLVIDVGK